MAEDQNSLNKTSEERIKLLDSLCDWQRCKHIATTRSSQRKNKTPNQGRSTTGRKKQKVADLIIMPSQRYFPPINPSQPSISMDQDARVFGLRSM
jgi:hypothetical protein